MIKFIVFTQHNGTKMAIDANDIEKILDVTGQATYRSKIVMKPFIEDRHHYPKETLAQLVAAIND